MKKKSTMDRRDFINRSLGAAVALWLPDGRAIFVPFGLPGELVRQELGIRQGAVFPLLPSHRSIRCNDLMLVGDHRFLPG